MPQADIAVVGAGLAGTLIAEGLVERGCRVVLIEAGPRPRACRPPPPTDERAWEYESEGVHFDWLRVRAVGGRGLLWGGWCDRLPDRVLRRGGWPYGASALAAEYDALERRLGVVEGPLDPRYGRMARALGVRVLPKRGATYAGSIWTPLSAPITRLARTRRAVTSLEWTARRATALELVDVGTGRGGTLGARAVVLAASPIETARILLASGLGRQSPAIGRNLVDHMVASYLLIEPCPGPIATPTRSSLLDGCALVETPINRRAGAERPYRGGFSIELSGPAPLSSLGADRVALLGVSPRQARGMSVTLLHAIGECFPHRRRWVELHESRRDTLGRPVPRIHLAWSASERRLAKDMAQACEAIANELSPPGGRLVPFLDPLAAEGVGHEAGTCAMGSDERSVCDGWGRLRALDNVWIADAAALPTAGDRHPTLTLLAHGRRVASSVVRWLQGRGAARS